jgi:hypothetical protein
MPFPVRLSAKFRHLDISPLCQVFILDSPSGYREVKLGPLNEFVLDVRDNATGFSVFVRGPSNLWEAEGFFLHLGGGKIDLVLRQPEFHVSAGGPPAPKIDTHLSLFRDATNEVRAVGFAQGKFLDPRSHGWLWKFNDLSKVRYISRGWQPGRPLGFEICEGTFGTRDVVLEVKRLSVPRLFAVSWPDRVVVDKPVSLLVYFRPTVTDKSDYKVNGNTYPFGKEYLELEFLQFLKYCRDPVKSDDYCNGLPLQIAAAGKAAALVLPLRKVGEEMGRFNDRNIGPALLDEILWFMCRLKGDFKTVPRLGRLALGCFSNGVIALEEFLGNNAGTPLYRESLSEVYLFGPYPMDVPRVRSWRLAKKALPTATKDNSDRVIRFYSEHSVRPFPDEDLGFSTRAQLVTAAWRAAGAVGNVHQLFARTLLTHAMRESLFPPGGPTSKVCTPAARGLSGAYARRAALVQVR